MYKKSIILILLIFLSACGNGDSNVSYPDDINYQDEVISWAEVSGATSYSVKINDTIYEVDDGHSFSVDFLPNGTYTVRLKAHRDHLSSYYSPSLTILIHRDYESFTFVTLNNDLLNWSAIPGILTYDVYNNHQLLASVSSSSYDLSTLNLASNQLFHLKVSATYPTQDTVYSETILYHTYENLDLTLEVTYTYLSNESLNITLGSQMSIDYILFDNIVIDGALYQITNHVLMISSDAFHLDEPGTYNLTLLTPAGYIMVAVTVVDLLKPMISSDASIVYTPGVDMVFQFELNGGFFAGLSGNEISSSDYLFTGDELTIYASFIERILSENPSRQSVILVYQLSKNSNLFMGFIFINIVPS